MFFIISKLLGFLVSPLSWVFILLIVAWLIKNARWKKRLYIGAVVVLFLFSNKALLSIALEAYQPMPVKLSATQQYSCGILLGGMGSYDEQGRGRFNENADRFIQTVKLYRSGNIKKILVTGGSSKISGDANYNEAFFVQENLLAIGVPAGDILMEKRARNTHENAIYSKQLLDSLGLKPPYVLITSATHVPRSLMVFKAAGMKDLVAYPTSYTVKERGFVNLYILPSAGVLWHWQKLFKEWFGIIAYSLTGRA